MSCNIVDKKNSYEQSKISLKASLYFFLGIMVFNLIMRVAMHYIELLVK